MPSASPSDLVAPLIEWFTANARSLPWRGVSDPYRVWVSEMMLQQTQVKAVLPYYAKWMETFPTLESLAAAPIEKVLKAWEGLGYYSRARNLHRASQQVVRDREGIFPNDFEEILSLPGIGVYSAGAIASLVFNRAVPAVDGNVVRVLARVDAINATGATLKRLVQKKAAAMSRYAGQRLNPQAHPRACGDLVESLIELGAVICTPRNPRCDVCPVRGNCRAFALRRTDVYPRRDARVAMVNREFTAVAAIADGSLLVRQRSGSAVNHGFWELPNIEGEMSLGEPFCKIKHAITSSRITLQVRMVSGSSRALMKTLQNAPSLLSGTERWADRAALDSLPFTGAHRKVITLLEKSGLMK